jgi:urea transport system permease protein
VNALKSWATRAYPDYWPIILGGMFLLVVLFLPRGLVGLVEHIVNLGRRSKKQPEPEPADPEAEPAGPAVNHVAAK